MSRNLDPSMKSGLPAAVIIPIHMVMLQFRTATKWLWSGPGDLVYGGNTYQGVGSLGKVGDTSEGVEINAEATSVSLSGIDAALLGESLADIRSGGAAKLWIALLRPDMSIRGVPYLRFRGSVDVPTVVPDQEKITIAIALEDRMVNQGRATNTKYTAADQRRLYPNDTAFNSVELLNDASFKEGQ